MYLVIGANGFLGSYIVKNILEITQEPIIATARDLTRVYNKERVKWVHCDLEDDESVDTISELIAKQNEPVNLIYLSAYHHPDEVDKNRIYAWNINVTRLSSFLEKIGGGVHRFVYASTDSVYGESVNGYLFKEDDKLNPVNFYGQSKCAAEALVVYFGFSVVRFPFLISPSLVYKKHFYDQIVADVKAGKDVEMYEDSYRSSLSFDNAAYILIKLLENKIDFDVLNICGDKALSKFEVGKLIAQRENIDSNRIIPIRMNVARDNFVTKRAGSTLMSNEKLKSMINVDMIDIFERPSFLT